MKKVLSFSMLLLFGFGTFVANAQSEAYKLPPKEIIDIVDAKPNQTVIFNSDYTSQVLLQRKSYSLELADIAGQEYRLAGIRINPNNFTITRQFYNNGMEVKVNGKDIVLTGMPSQPKIAVAKWSPSNKYIAFTNVTDNEVELYRVEVATGEAKKINTYKLNAVTTSSNVFEFLNDQEILYYAVPKNAGNLPVGDPIPKGPTVQEVYGKKVGGRTIADVISNPLEEQIFEYLATSQMVIFSDSGTREIGAPAIYSQMNLSPDSKYMMIKTTHKPFSYLLGYQSFPSKSLLISVSDGAVIKTLNDGTVEEPKTDKKAPKIVKPTGYAWRADRPSTLTWQLRAVSTPEEKKEDAPKADTVKKETPEKTFQTTVYQVAAPFTAEPEFVVSSEYSFSGITWGNDKIALYNDSSSKQKIRRVVRFVPQDSTAKQQVLWTTSTELDSITPSPVIGRPYTVNSIYPNGSKVLWTDKNITQILLTGSRPDAEGDNMSFLDKFNLKTLKSTTLWTSVAPYNTGLLSITDFKNLTLIVSRQSAMEPINYFKLVVKGNKITPLTSFVDPIPAIRELGREFVTYKRKDGVTLSAILITPKGYDKEKDGKLPVYIWAYPYEYKTAVEAQKSRPARYNFLSNGSAAVLATQGYAVLLDASMYIISDNKKNEPNDVFISNLIANAEAAINFIDSIGVGDRNRVAVGGHSYGSFMTAHLLSQTKLFTAGIARSGAFNRSLTPFGFQSERRDYWKAPELYFKMSPFSYVNELKTPILIVHGQLDENSGTFPVQSERLYHAISYFGGTSRYVILPYETHSYRARPNVLQLWEETISWLDKYTKNAKPKEKKAEEKSDTPKSDE